MSDSDYAITASELTKRYRLYDSQSQRLKELLSPTRKQYGRDFWAVNGLSIEIPRGSVYGLIGHNGAGKSTTLKMLAGKLRPTSGKLTVDGKISSILQLGTGLQPQLTGRQNARINALFMGIPPWDVEDKLESILDFSELGHYADQPLEYYSSGMKARLAFSVLTALEPDILLLDEALSAGDAQFGAKCRRFIRGLCTSGCTTVVVSHDLSFLAETCDEITWMDHGKPKSQGRPAEVIREYLLDSGEAADFSYRPKNLLLRIKAVEPSDETYLLQSVHFAAANSEVLAIHHPPEPKSRTTLLEAACELGLSREAAMAGWGGARLLAGVELPFQELRPNQGLDGYVYLALPLPPVPKPLPAVVNFAGDHSLEKELELAAFKDGEFVPIRRFGPGSGYYNEVFSLEGILPSAQADPA